jgi:nucleoside-diphosphate-sugar epimerase
VQHNFVYLSSCAVYPAELQGRAARHNNRRLNEYDTDFLQPPCDVYGWTKLIGEQMARQAFAAGVNMFIVRPFSGYGEDQSADFPMRAFAQRAQAHEDPFTIWGSATQVRDWIHIDDIVDGIMALVDAGVASVNGVLYPVNLCTGVGTDMATVARMMCDAAGYTPPIIVDHEAPLGALYRVGQPDLFHSMYKPKITLEEGVRRMMI